VDEARLTAKTLGFRALSTATLVGSLAALGYSLSFYGLPAIEADALRDALLLIALAIAGEELSVWFSDRMTLSASNLPILLAVMFLDPSTAIIVAAVVGVWGAWREDSHDLAVFNASNFVLSAFMAIVVFQIAATSLGVEAGVLSVALLVAGMAASVAHECTNLLVLSLGARVKYGKDVTTFWREEARPFFTSLLLLSGLGLAVAALYATAGIIAVVLLFIPLLASQYMFKLLVREREHVARQKLLSDQYLEMNIGLAAAMVVLLDSKDEYTAQHSAAVAMYCRDIAMALGLPDEEVEAVHLAGLLHDLGKVGVPDAVLRKTQALEEEDWDYLRQHPEKGAEVLSHLANYEDVADIVRYHHERLDGSGYPLGVHGDAIPKLSRILAVADSYHAMTSDRPYRAKRGSFEALKELRLLAGHTLDEQYVEALASVLRDKNLSYRDGSSTDFMGEYERGRLNLRLRGRALADVSDLAGVREDPAAG
jgi:putative nucleotidyltransferase with HDIG domain